MKNKSEIERNQTATAPSIYPWSCAFGLSSVSMQDHFLRGINFEYIEAVEGGSHRTLHIKKPETGTVVH